ncbi:fimbria/pilus periplasmic chaperone [Psychrilyobacter atlanticus]|uniref:fimbria/pilus periplasmic chaperone n=1 Tax=Psychrilyobacter atlanticus TaxID=271091 RepID=UPI00040FABCF|nr:fimbria/pilus periplasmic chaperone [Psychrilyobacter atlanticus]
MKKIIVSLLVGLTVSANVFAISISPKIIEAKLVNQEVFKEIRVKNDTNTPKRYKVSIIKPINIGSDDYYIGNHIEFYPPILNLKPNDTKSIKLLIEDFKDLQDGEYRCYLSLDEITPSNAKGISIRINLNSAIYANKGKLNKSLEINDFKINDTHVQGVIENKGNTSLKIIARYLMDDGTTVDHEFFIGRKGNHDLKYNGKNKVVQVDLLDRDTKKHIKTLKI